MKIAIIASGGGMSCSYIAGVLLALAKKYNLTEPYIVIGGSGGSITLAYYVSQQYDLIKEVPKKYLTQTRFINILRFWKMADVDYLIDEICKKRAPLDIATIQKSKTKFFVCATDEKEGHPRCFDCKSRDVFEIMRASLALPVLYGKKVQLGEKHYIDTYASTSIELNAMFALEQGADKLIIINNEYHDEVIEKVLGVAAGIKGKIFKENYLAHLDRRKLFKKEDAIVIEPKIKSRNIIRNDPAYIQALMDEGYKDACENEELQALLKDIR